MKTLRDAAPIKIDKAFFMAMAGDERGVDRSDCALAGDPIAQGMAPLGTPAKALQPSISVLRLA